MDADAERCWLFAYGLLQPGYQPPRTVRAAWPDAVRGQLFDLGRYPAAIDVGRAGSWIEGSVLEIAWEELIHRLDPFEGVAQGLYQRIQTTSRSGRLVWVYEYFKPLAPGAPRLPGRWAPAAPARKNPLRI